VAEGKVGDGVHDRLLLLAGRWRAEEDGVGVVGGGFSSKRLLMVIG
jgi:hypothetical protein